MPPFNWQTATFEQVQERVDGALRLGQRTMSVDVKWLKALIRQHKWQIDQLTLENEHLKAKVKATE